MATRTQIYLTDDQRRLVDRVAARDGISMAEVIRRALEQYLDTVDADPSTALDATFGATPDLDVPTRDEWARG